MAIRIDNVNYDTFFFGFNYAPKSREGRIDNGILSREGRLQ